LAQHRKTHEREDGSSDVPGLYNSEEDAEGDEPIMSMEGDTPEPEHHHDLSSSMANVTSMGQNLAAIGSLGLAAAGLTSHPALLQQAI
jgi:hypothetical protein